MPNYCGTKKTLGGPGFRSRNGANWAGISLLALQKTIVNDIVNGFVKANKSPDPELACSTHMPMLASDIVERHLWRVYERADIGGICPIATDDRRSLRHRAPSPKSNAGLPSRLGFGDEFIPLDDAATGSTIGYVC